MIFYFSGTGNSYYVASKIASRAGEGLAPIACLMRNAEGGYEYTLRDGETVGFIYPIYAWAPRELEGKFKFARQKSKLAGTIRGSFFVIKKEY